MNAKGKGSISDSVPTELTPEQDAQLRASDSRPVNTGDIPEAPAASWAHARQFYRPRKEAISIRLDADVLDWLRRGSDRYQSRINEILRSHMEAETS